MDDSPTAAAEGVRHPMNDPTTDEAYVPAPVCDETTGCITCGDVAIEARVVSIRNGTAMIEKDGLREEVAVDLVEGVRVGDVVLCHAGVALERVPA